MLLREEDIKIYDGVRAPMTELGEFVYYRTYSRWLEGLGRRERWLETITRTIEYSLGLELKHRIKEGLPVNEEMMRAEAKELLDNMFNLRQFASGRTMWVGGTKVAEKFPMSNFNCSFIVLTGDTFEAFGELFYLLMIGTGVGFRTMPYDVDRLPHYRTDIEVIHKDYRAKSRSERKDLSEIEIVGDTAIIHIGDSKEGWVSALDLYFKILTSFLYNGIKYIIFDYDSVRPKGERLKTFGGTASGYQSLENMFTKIDKVMKQAGGKLKPIDVLDVGNIIGENVVVGGVRRTAEINLASKDDNAIETAKTNIYKQDAEGNWIVNDEIIHRMMSNNSIFYEAKPTREELHQNFVNMRYTGERGFVNAEKGRKIRADFAGMNPCAEIMLADRGLCNLSTVNVMAFVHEDAMGNVYLDRDALLQACRLSARIGVRMTLVDLEIQAWDKQAKKDRLIGCSLTGWFDMVDAFGLSKAEQKKLRKDMKKATRGEADRYADELGIPRPLLSTTIKPEGTISQLPTVSSGLHRSHSPFYIRRVRINANDPLVQVAKELGWDISPENGQTWENASTLVVSFPVKSPVKVTKNDVSAIEQLETYKEFMSDYVEHNASNTVTVREDEWDAVEEWVWNNWDDFVAVSFLPHSDAVYQQAPYEEITEEQYEEMKARYKAFDANLLMKYEKEEVEIDLGNDGCDTGVCPIR